MSGYLIHWCFGLYTLDLHKTESSFLLVHAPPALLFLRASCLCRLLSGHLGVGCWFAGHPAHEGTLLVGELLLSVFLHQTAVKGV